jgi:hypothetical protein
VGFTQTGQGAAILANGGASTQLIFELLRSIAIAYDWQAYRPIERKLDARIASCIPRMWAHTISFPVLLPRSAQMGIDCS